MIDGCPGFPSSRSRSWRTSPRSLDGSRLAARDEIGGPLDACGILGAMDLTLTPAQIELQTRARAFVRDELQPREAEFERANGRVPRDWGDPIRRAAIEARLHGGSLPRDVGGQGWSVVEQVLVHEQLGQSTGGLWSYIPGAYNVLLHADPDQRRRYLDPRTGPAPMRERCARRRSVTRRPATTGSTGRSGSSPARTTPTS